MARDTTLTRRMALTLALVLAVDAVFVAVLGFLLNPWLAPLRDPLVRSLGVVFGSAVYWLALAIPALAAFLWLQIAYTRREAFADVDARPVAPDEYPDLHNRVARLARGTGVLAPTVAVAASEVPNAFTVGGLRDATLVVSEGLLDELDGDELDAVLAHELAHVANRDATVMTLSSFLPALVTSDVSPTEVLFGEGTAGSLAVWLPVLSVGYVVSLPLTGGNPVEYVAIVAAVLVVAGVALGLLGIPMVVLSQRLSQYREFAADRAGARVTGDPAALAGVLERLDDGTTAREDARTAYDGVRGLCLLPYGFADRAAADAGGAEDAADDSFTLRTRSHPDTAERVARLRELYAELEG